jgi:NADP-dependent 3-hydroxy acid dehydrogenase YdfG
LADPGLSGRGAVVTGASRGIGRETAIRLAAAGARLVLVARASDDFTRLSSELDDSAISVTADLADRSAVETTADTVSARIGVPDILVNNAGAFHVAPLSDLSVDEFERSLHLNILAPFMLARFFLPGMIARGSGHVVTVGSVADRYVFPENAAYASSKFGLRALHEVLRLETRGSGVRATLVSPGPVDTRLWDPVNPDGREGYTPRASMLDPASVAEAIMFALTRPRHVDIEELRLSRA